MDTTAIPAVLWERPVLSLMGALIALLVAHRLFFRGRDGGYVLPPGPPRLPLLGNFFDMPPAGELEFQHWLKHKRYGPISSVTMMGQHLVILHDRDAARFLLDQCSKSTSSRPHMEFGHNLCSFSNLLPLQKYEDSSYRRRRRLCHQHLGTLSASERYKGLHEVHAGVLLQRVLESPDRLMAHLKSFTAAIILDATYGYTLEPSAEPDPILTSIQGVIDNSTEAFVPMKWLVDVIPALQHLPGWLPGTGFLKTAEEWKQNAEDAADMPYTFVQEQMRSGAHRPSYVSHILERQDHDADGDSDSDADKPSRQAADKDDIRWTAASMYGAGFETSRSTLEAFVRAMLMFPEVQRKAQQEIDTVVGTDRLPSFRDQPNLPYTAHIVTETLRWFPVLPMGVVHTSQEDVAYDKYLIPKGSYLVPAVWWFCHDPAVHADPDTFDPERYLAPRNEPDPRAVMFGYGRRICVGRYFAESSMFITVARLLATFTITSGTDGQGQAKTLEFESRPSLTIRPAKFACKLVPRSAKHVALINSVEPIS